METVNRIVTEQSRMVKIKDFLCNFNKNIQRGHADVKKSECINDSGKFKRSQEFSCNG